MPRMIFGSCPNRSTTFSAIASGRRGILLEQAVAARLQRRVEVHVGREAQQADDVAQVEQLLVGELGEPVRDLFEHPVRRLDEVVLAHEPAIVARRRR